MSAHAFDTIIAAPFGALGVRIDDDVLDQIAFLPPGTPAKAPRNALAQRAAEQLGAYLDDPRTRFDLPLKPAGTVFQRRVWAAIRAIPCGKVRAYGALATELASAARAVGQACGANPFPVVVPCHRVVAQAALGGFAHARDGFLLDTKRWLLAHEARR